ncbi:phage repressor protein CI [Photobacterium ganghwense]|uniref:phage repressor protein CI n=1 Tax=Photobacterium ganghwense TaxID=320778 RepID=UPI001A90CADA|nr:phage repressor protein CI [Photobacterium ganghwense]QSV15856.1 phage repressor protein CI [Photobacterium ganghwense]
MTNRQDQLQPYDYIGGKDLTSRFVKALGLSQFKELTDKLGIGHGTVSTWHTRNQTPFEIAVRIHLSTGVSLKWLLLGEGEMYEGGKPSNSTDKVELPYFELKNGDLIDKGKMFFDPMFLEGMPNAEHLMLVEHEGKKLFVDKSKTKAISGQYLINIDGDVSLNSMQKLPGNMVAIEFSQSTVQLDEGDVEVIGKAI